MISLCAPNFDSVHHLYRSYHFPQVNPLVPGLKLLEYNSLPLLQGDVAKRPKFKFNERREHEKTIWCSFSELRYSLSEFYSRKICQYLTNWTRQIMSKEVWSSTNSLLCHIFAIAVLVDAEAPSYKQLLELWHGWGRFTRVQFIVIWTIYTPNISFQELRECTADMDANTWNSYHIISNRARSICYATRQQQFRLKTEFTVNKLANQAENQMHLMNHLQVSLFETVNDCCE